MLQEIKTDYGYLRVVDNYSKIRAALTATGFAFKDWFQPVICRLFGHDYETMAYPEDGGEEVWCNRCGHNWSAWF